MSKDTPQFKQIQEINYNGILKSVTAASRAIQAIRVLLSIPRVENTIDPAITAFNFPGLACTDATYQRRFIHAALLWIINDMFPISVNLV